LIEAMGASMINEYAPLIQPSPERVPTSEFLSMCADIVLGNYHNVTLEAFLSETFKATVEQVAILTKKLKGVYAKDVKTLESLFGEGDYDVEFYHIQRILNNERMARYLPAEMTEAIVAIKGAVAVDEGLKVEVSYNKE